MNPDLIEIRTRPLENWPRPFTENRKGAPFRSTYLNTMSLLRREVARIAAGPIVVVELAISEGDVRQDGQPRASARPGHPGAAVSFESVHGPLRYLADRFLRWQDNVRAVALGLESLRRVDRYGVSSRGEQYRGWAQLPSGVDNGMTLEEATELLSAFSGLLPTTITTPGGLKAAYRAAAKKHHPDAGGDPDVFDRYRRAHDTIKATL